MKILGVRSQNGRVYLPEALAAAVGLYEGAKVNVNHPKGHPRAPRGYEERIGALRGVTVRPGEGLFGDFHFNPRHALAEQLLWDASHAPQNVGLSHNVEARLARRDQGWVVEAISRVVSVDLVADPATTAGLFEEAAVPVISPPPLADLTCEQLHAARPDLVESLLAESHAALTAENERLRKEVDELAAAAITTQRRDQVAALLAEYHLPPAGSSDPVAKAITSETFVAALLEATDEAAMRMLIAERAELIEAARQRVTSGASPAPAARPVSRSPRTLDPPPLDTLSFVRALRG